MFNVIEAVRLELDAFLGSSSAIGVRGSAAAIAYNRFLQDVGRNRAGETIGSAARGLTSFIAKLPLITLTSDSIKQSQCVDLLLKDVRKNPQGALRLVQLAEAVDATQRLQSFVRISQLVNPSSLILGTALRSATNLGKDGQSTTVERLLRASHRRATESRTDEFVRHFCLSRVYQLAGKPRLALDHAREAYLIAHQHRISYRPPVVDWSDETMSVLLSWVMRTAQRAFESFEDAAESAAASLSGDFVQLDLERQMLLREGAALQCLGRSFLALGDHNAARSMASQAVDLGYSEAHQLNAALVSKNDGGLMARFEERINYLNQIQRLDRVYWHGHWRGSIRIGASVVGVQLDKLSELSRNSP